MAVEEREGMESANGVEQPVDEEARIGRLRGAQVAAVDAGRLRTVAVAVCAAALLVTAVFLFAAGARRNAQVAALHDNGVRVTVTVAACQGQLGGSGFNFVGYSCQGDYTQAGHRYHVSIPGSTFRPAGSTVTLVADPADPRLVSTISAAQSSQPSAGVYILPAALLAAAAGLGVFMAMGRRRTRSARRYPAPQPVLPAP